MPQGHDPEDYRLYRSQRAAMTAILRHVSRDGYTWHLSTKTPTDRVLKAVRILDQKHAVLAAPWERQIRRAAGKPLAHLVLAPEPKGGAWPYVLLGTRKLKGEAMRRIDDPRRPLTWWAYREKTGWTPFYRLVLHPTTGTYTWEVVPEVFEEYLNKVVAAAAGEDWPALARTLKSFYVLPQFRGVNEQAKRLFKTASRIWGNRYLRTPEGTSMPPPFREVSPPPTARGAGIRLYVTEEEARGGRPRTLGEALRGLLEEETP